MEVFPHCAKLLLQCPFIVSSVHLANMLLYPNLLLKGEVVIYIVTMDRRSDLQVGSAISIVPKALVNRI